MFWIQWGRTKKKKREKKNRKRAEIMDLISIWTLKAVADDLAGETDVIMKGRNVSLNLYDFSMLHTARLSAERPADTSRRIQNKY